MKDFVLIQKRKQEKDNPHTTAIKGVQLDILFKKAKTYTTQVFWPPSGRKSHWRAYFKCTEDVWCQSFEHDLHSQSIPQ